MKAHLQKYRAKVRAGRAWRAAWRAGLHYLLLPGSLHHHAAPAPTPCLTCSCAHPLLPPQLGIQIKHAGTGGRCRRRRSGTSPSLSLRSKRRASEIDSEDDGAACRLLRAPPPPACADAPASVSGAPLQAVPAAELAASLERARGLANRLRQYSQLVTALHQDLDREIERAEALCCTLAASATDASVGGAPGGDGSGMTAAAAAPPAPLPPPNPFARVDSGVPGQLAALVRQQVLAEVGDHAGKGPFAGGATSTEAPGGAAGGVQLELSNLHSLRSLPLGSTNEASGGLAALLRSGGAEAGSLALAEAGGGAAGMQAALLQAGLGELAGLDLSGLDLASMDPSALSSVLLAAMAATASVPVPIRGALGVAEPRALVQPTILEAAE